jgi:hypothetical protein
MLYVVLAAGRPGETGPQDRFFQARKQAQSFPVGSAGTHFVGLPLWPPHVCRTRTDSVYTLGREEGGPLPTSDRTLASKTGRGLVRAPA